MPSIAPRALRIVVLDMLKRPAYGVPRSAITKMTLPRETAHRPIVMIDNMLRGATSLEQGENDHEPEDQDPVERIEPELSCVLDQAEAALRYILVTIGAQCSDPLMRPVGRREPAQFDTEPVDLCSSTDDPPTRGTPETSAYCTPVGGGSSGHVLAMTAAV